MFKKKYRIVPYSYSGYRSYIVEKKYLWFWVTVSLCSNISEAEAVINHMLQEPKYYGS